MSDNELLLAISDIMDKKLDANLKTLETKLDTKITRIALSIENDVLPRLQNIESCYTDTYHRYQENNEKMQAAFEDIKLIKQVIREHSEKLKKLA